MRQVPVTRHGERLILLLFVYLFQQKVIEVSKKYLPEMAKSFSSPKLKLHVGDGFEYMKQHQGEYDVIITDSSDPVGEFKDVLCLSLNKIFLFQKFNEI